jgi:hypothetical protein
MTMSAIARKLEFVDFPREPVDCSAGRGKRQDLTLASSAKARMRYALSLKWIFDMLSNAR